MLKVKRSVTPKSSNAEIDEWQNDIKNSIKSLYLKSKNDSDLINKYEKTFQTLKNEYTLLYKRNEELENKLKEFETREKIQIENERKRPLSRYDYENDENENVQYIVRKKRKTPQKIIYEEESESEDDEMNVDNKNTKVEEITEKKKSNKKGISKSIKM